MIAPAQAADKKAGLKTRLSQLRNQEPGEEEWKSDPATAAAWLKPLSVLATFAYWTAVCLEPELLVMAKH